MSQYLLAIPNYIMMQHLMIKTMLMIGINDITFFLHFYYYFSNIYIILNNTFLENQYFPSDITSKNICCFLTFRLQQHTNNETVQ